MKQSTATGILSSRMVVLALTAILVILSSASVWAKNWDCPGDPGNDSVGTATPLGISCGITPAAIDCIGDIDFYAWTAPISGPYTVETTGTTDTFLELYDGAGNLIISDDDSGDGTNAKIVYTGDGQWGGQLFMRVSEYNNDATGDYELHISGCSGGGCGDDPGNDDPGSATPLSGCGSTPASIDCVGDKDFYSLVAPNSGSYTFETTGTTDTYMILTDGNDHALTFDDDSGDNSNARIVYTLVGGQTYKVGVNEYQDDATGDYSLDISGCTAACGDDPGDDTGEAATVLRSGCGDLSGKAIDCPGDIDFYSWTASDAGTYTFAVTPTNTMRLTLFTAAGSFIAEGPSVDHAMTGGETVHIRIMSQSSLDTPSYTMTISGCSSGGCGNDPGNDTTNTATDLGSSCSTTSAAVDCIGDVDYYAWTAPSTGSFTFETTGPTDTYMSLYNNAGDPITSDDDSGAESNAKIVYTVGAGQQYYISVAEYLSDATGDYALVISGCSSGGCGNDPDNDTTGTATDLGSSCSTTHAAIDCQDDTDYYSFTAALGGSYTFGVSSAQTMRLTLFDSAGSWIGETTSTFDYTMSFGEKVYVRMLPQDGAATPSYDLTISGCSSGGCENDPGNNSLAEATALSGCGTTQAAIDCDGDLDYYWLNAPNSGSFTFETTGSTDTELRLYDANGDAIASDDDSGDNSNARIVYTLVGGQKYSVAVNEYGNNDTGDYALVISGCLGGGCGNDPGNETTNTATDLGSSCSTTSAAIDCQDDTDFYSFTAPLAASYTFGVSSAQTMRLTLFDSAGSWIGETTSTFDYTMSFAEKVYVRMLPQDGAATPSYDLTISGCDAVGCGADPGNDNIQEATRLPACETLLDPTAIDCIGDVDFYLFEAPEDGTYTFETTGTTDTFLALYDPDGNLIKSDNDSGAGTNAKIVYAAVAGVPYYLRVSEYNNDATGDYELHISGCPGGGCGNDPGNDAFASATVFSGCGTTSASIDCPTDQDYYQFSPSNSGVYTFTIQVSFNALIELYDANHVLLGQNAYQITHDLAPASGPYFVAVVSPLDLTGDYDLSISGCDNGGGGCTGDADGDTVSGATTLPGCGSTSAAFDCPGDVDYFKLVPTTSGVYAFETTGSMDTRIWLENAQGATLDFDDDSGQGSNARIEWTLESGTQYFVRIEEYNNDDIGSYGLSVTGCNAASCGQDAEGDTLATAVSLSTCGATDARFDCTDDIDVFRFEAPLSVDFTFTTTGAMDTVIRLLDGNGNPLASDDDSGSGANASLMRSMTAGEAVFLEVTEGDGHEGAYSVEIAGCDTTGEPPNQFRYVITSVAKVAGSAGTNWVSDLSILNVGDGVGDVTISRWERDQANPNPQAVHRTLDAGQMERTSDVLFSLFGQSQGAAALLVLSDQPLVIGSRTYNTVEDKTYGQFIPGVALHDAIPSGEQVVLSGLTENEFFRTNLGLVNPGDASIQVTGAFFDAQSNSLGSRTWTIPAHGYIQRNRVLREVTSQPASEVWIRLTSNTGEFFSFLSIVDQHSGDPVYRPGRTAPTASRDVLIPGVAKLAGAAGTNWVTDTIFTNSTQSASTVKISLWNRDQNNINPSQRSFLLKPERMVELSDVLYSLFGENAGAAALDVSLESGILADGRTYNQVDEGTYGQYIPGLDQGAAVTHHRKGYLVMPVQNAGFRANLGLINPGTTAVDVEVRLYDASGAQLGSARSWNLAGRAVKQVDRIVRQFTNQDLDSGWMEISVKDSTPNGQVLIFDSVVDQVSGDPIFESTTLEP